MLVVIQTFDCMYRESSTVLVRRGGLEHAVQVGHMVALHLAHARGTGPRVGKLPAGRPRPTVRVRGLEGTRSARAGSETLVVDRPGTG